MADVIDLVNKLTNAPESRKDFDAWIEQKDAVAFLHNNSRREEIIVSLSATSAFMHAVAVPAANVNPPDTEDLMSWNLDPCTSWGIEANYSGGASGSISIAEPMSSMGCKSLRNGEKFVFSRSFDGRQGEKHYYEILQKFAHVFGLHYLQERNAY